MAIDLNELRTFLNKCSSQNKDLPPAQQAMAGAAQAMGGIPGQIKAPNIMPNQGDPAGDALAMEQEQKAIQDEMDKKDQELERLRNEKTTMETKLQQEQIARMQSESKAQIEQERAKFQQEMQKAQEELSRNQAIAEAEEIQHKSKLDQQAAEQAAQLANDKAQMMTDLANEKTKMLTDMANQQAQRYVKTTEDAAKNIAKQREDSYKQIDDYRSKSMEAIESARPGVSPALESQMQGAIAAMSRAGKIKDRMHTIPKPGTRPGNLTMPQEGLNPGVMGKMAGYKANSPEEQARSEESWLRYSPKTYQQRAQLASGVPNTSGWGLPQWIAAAGSLGLGVPAVLNAFGDQEGAAEEDAGEIAPQNTATPRAVTPSFNQPQPSFNPPQSADKNAPAITTPRLTAMNPQQARTKMARLITPVPGGIPKKANYDSLDQRSVRIADMENALWQAQHAGDAASVKSLQSSINAHRKALDTYKQQVEARVRKGDAVARRELARYNDLHREYTDWGNWSLVNEVGGWFGGEGNKDTRSSAYRDIANQSRRAYEAGQWEKQKDAETGWETAGRWTGNVGRFLVDDLLGGGYAKIREGIQNYNIMNDMARDRGVTINWNSENTGNAEDLRDFNDAAAYYNVSTNPYAHLGRGALGVGELGVTFATGGAAGLVAKGALKGAGKLGLKGAARLTASKTPWVGRTALPAWVGKAEAVNTFAPISAEVGLGLTDVFNPGWRSETPEGDGSLTKTILSGIGGQYGRYGEALHPETGSLMLSKHQPTNRPATTGELRDIRTGSGVPHYKAVERYFADNPPAPYPPVTGGAAQTAMNPQQAGQMRKKSNAAQPMNPQQTQIPVKIEYSKRPIKMGPNSAQDWNRYGASQDFTLRGVKDYFQGNRILRAAGTYAPYVSMLTGGLINLVRSPNNMYNSAYVLDPNSMSARMLDTSNDPKFRRAGDGQYISQGIQALSQQHSAAHQPSIVTYQPAWAQLDGRKA